MPLSHTDPDDDDDLGSLAALFWQHHDRFVGGASETAPEAVVPSGLDRHSCDKVLAEAEARVTGILGVPADRDDMVLALVFGRRNNDSDLEALGEGVLGDLVRAGDDDLLLRLRHRGVAAAVVAVIGRAVIGRAV